MAVTASQASQTMPVGLIGSQQQAAAQAGGQTIYTFRQAAARRRQSSVYILNLTSGQPYQQELRHVGYLNNLYLKVTGTITVGTTGTVQETQDSENYLPLLQILTPASNSPHTMSFRSLMGLNYKLFKSTNPRTAPGYAIWAPGTSGAQNIQVVCRLPLALNNGRNFATCLVPRNSQQAWYLSGRAAAPGDLVGSGSAVVTVTSLTLEIGEEWYDAIGMANVIMPDFLIASRIREAVPKTSLATTDNTFPYPTPGPTLLELFHQVYLGPNGTLNHASVDRVQLFADGEYYFDDRNAPQVRDDDMQAYGQALPTGWLGESFFEDTLVQNESLGRDQIDATLYSQLLHNVRLLTNANIANSKVVTLYRELVDLQLPAGTAG